MNFRSDNTAPAAPEIIAALTRVNEGAALAYGEDEWSKRLDGSFSEVFEREVRVFTVASGTAGCDPGPCYFAGLYDQNLAIGDLDGDGKHDLVLPHDNAYASFFKGTGAAYRPEREAQVLARMAAANPGPLPDDAVTGVFRQIMSACLALERRLAIGYLGPAGTLSHAAVHRHFGDCVDAVPYAAATR